jgi:protein TonB
MKKRSPKPLHFFLGLSVLVHSGLLLMAPVKARPAAVFQNQGPRVALVNLPRPAPPQAASPPRPAPLETPAPKDPREIPPEPVPAIEGPAAEQPLEETGPPGSPVYSNPALREDAVSRYLAMIRGLIDRRKEYPYQARRQEQEGTVLVRFTITRRGTLAGEPVLEKKSRHERLNASAIAAVKNAAPYPPFPGEIGDDEMSLQVAVNFSLEHDP